MFNQSGQCVICYLHVRLSLLARAGLGPGCPYGRADAVQISKVKERVEEKAGIPPAQQRLIYGGKAM